MTEPKKSQIRKSLDQEVIPAHTKWLHDYPANAPGDLEFQRTPRQWPAHKLPRPPMAALPPNGSIFVDGQRAGPTPAEWSRPAARSLVLASEPAEPLTEVQAREQRRARKAKELADRQARSAARRAREAEEAERAGPPTPTMSEAARKHFMKLLDKRHRENW